MTTRTRVLLVCGPLFVLAAVAVVVLLAVSGTGAGPARSPDGRFATVQRGVASPSGRWIAAAVPGPEQDGVETWVPVVRDATGREVFRDDTAYSTRQGVGITWLSSADQLWVLSADVGTTRVDRRPDGSWVETGFSPASVEEIPPEIAELED